jgi:hypothetical protein
MGNNSDNPSYSRTRYILIGLLAVVGLYLVIDHGRHLAPYFPFVFLLGCLFMHLFMHGGHRGHDTHVHERGGDTKR